MYYKEWHFLPNETLIWTHLICFRLWNVELPLPQFTCPKIRGKNVERKARIGRKGDSVVKFHLSSQHSLHTKLLYWGLIIFLIFPHILFIFAQWKKKKPPFAFKINMFTPNICIFYGQKTWTVMCLLRSSNSDYSFHFHYVPLGSTEKLNINLEFRCNFFIFESIFYYTRILMEK